MKFTAAKMAVAALAIGVSLGGCATRESVERAQASADSADRHADAADHHAGMAQARADEAYGVGNQALGVGNGAMSAAQMANQKADANSADVSRLKRQVAYLQWKVLPHHRKKARHHHHTTHSQARPDNS